jgi:hypothetical protein
MEKGIFCFIFLSHRGMVPGNITGGGVSVIEWPFIAM